MTDPTAPEPLAPDVVDELLSALADGEFDAAARDLGFTPEDARARLAATPGADARAEALRDASARFAEEPTLDELARRRLVTNATLPALEATRARRKHALATGAGIAAALVVVLGLIGAMVSSSRSGDDASSAAGGAKSAVDDSAANTEASGINDSEQLRRYVQRVEERRRGLLDNSAKGDAAGSASSTTPAAAEAPAAGGESSSDATRSGAQAYSSQDCVAAISKGLDLTTVPISLEGTRYRGRPAVVAVFSQAGRNVGVLYNRADCRVLITSSEIAK
jgi:hypothetical protein